MGSSHEGPAKSANSLGIMLRLRYRNTTRTEGENNALARGETGSAVVCPGRALLRGGTSGLPGVPPAALRLPLALGPAHRIPLHRLRLQRRPRRGDGAVVLLPGRAADDELVVGAAVVAIRGQKSEVRGQRSVET